MNLKLMLSILTFCYLPFSCQVKKSNASCIIPQKIDMGNLKTGDSTTKEVIVLNNGEENLLIKQVQTTCRCVATSFDKVVTPGSTGKIRIKFKASKSGSVEQLALVETNTIPVLRKITIVGLVE